MSIDVFDVVYCTTTKCQIANTCGRHLDRFKEFLEKQVEAIPVTNIVSMDFSVDLSKLNLETSCYLDPEDVRK